MEFLVEFEIKVPEGTPVPEVTDRFQAEAAAAAKLAAKGHIERIWKRPQATGESDVLGLYVAESKGELDALLEGLPLQGWMNVTVTPLEPHPNDPAALRLSSGAAPVTGPACPNRTWPWSTGWRRLLVNRRTSARLPGATAALCP